MTYLLSLDELDTACQAQWREGHVAGCRPLATQLAQRAREVDDAPLEARGLLHLARCDLREAAYLDALSSARLAAGLFALEDIADSEVEALALACMASTALHRLDEALDWGLQAMALAEDCPEPLALVLAADPLGLAQAWAGEAEAADRTFAAGLERARLLGRSDWLAHLAIHRACAAALATVLTLDDLPPPRRAASLDRLGEVIEQALGCCERAPGVPNAVTQRPGRFLLGWVQVLHACWAGEPLLAQQLLGRIRPLVRREHGWLDLLALCASAEVARALNLHAQAEATAREVMAEATKLSHLALADLAAGLLSRVLAQDGRPAQALELERERARLRRQTRTQALPRRTSAARDELALRARLRQRSAAVPRPSEDSLTGLADRHQFIQRLEGLLQRADVGRARCTVLCVAVADAALIAARHGPLVRDRVLCTVAALLRQLLRSGDLPARWTHDEFAVLLHRSGHEESGRIAERVVRAVAAHDWTALAEGLQVRVHCGHALTGAGDTVTQLMRRCDDALHASMRGRKQAA